MRSSKPTNMQIHKPLVLLSLVISMFVCTLIAVTIVNLQYLHKSKALSIHEETINVLDYFVSKNRSKELTGTHDLSQTVVGQNAYFVKFFSAHQYEHYSWDNSFIYLKEDRSSAPTQYYNFTDGIWMKRYMKVGEKIVAAKNVVTYYSNCTKTASQPFAYTITLEKHIPQYDLGGDLGVQDVIQLKYDYYAQNFERFYYSKKWGWVKWELVDRKGNIVQESTFNKISSNHPLWPDTTVPCAKCIRNNIPTSMRPGESKQVTIMLQNTGTTVWTADPQYPFRLGSQMPRDNKIWGVGRVDLSRSVFPRQLYSFTFTLTAPRIPGTYSSEWQLLQEGKFSVGGVCGPKTVKVAY